LHQRQLVHFDLKPGNIFLQDQRARVGDYGLAKFFEKGNQTLSFGRGTPHYMAPEILMGRADHRADMYSFGVMLYEALTGRKPYLDQASDPLALRQPDDPLPAMGTIRPEVAAVVERCLEWDPDDRFQTMGELLGALPYPPGSSFTAPNGVYTNGEDASRWSAASEVSSGGWMHTSIFVLLFVLIGFLISLGGMALLRGLIV
ncbi:MAG TPA: protein kinase, partial [Planctomycetota bacterium]|nr:protein kinase [Planctomycetota bacterium]